MLPLFTYGQSNTTRIGAPNTTVVSSGGLRADSAFQLPIIRMTKRYAKGIDTSAQMFAATVDTLPYYMKNGNVSRIMIQSDSNTATGFTTAHYVNQRIAQSTSSGRKLTIGDTVVGAPAGSLLYAMDTVLTSDENVTIENVPYISYFQSSSSSIEVEIGVRRELHSIYLLPASTETVRIGTTPGGDDLLPDTEITTAGMSLSINKMLSVISNVSIYITGATSNTTYRIIQL
jgi:hypothetical protein